MSFTHNFKMEKYVINNLAQYIKSFHKHLKVIAVWQMNNYVNKMQEKDSKIPMVWEKIKPEVVCKVSVPVRRL